MIGHPGALIGLPTGVPNVVYDIAPWRYLLLLLAGCAGYCEAKNRRRAALSFAVVFATFAIAFWVAAFGQPYGVLADEALTRWAADVSVAGSAGGNDRFLAGEPGDETVWIWLARHVRPDVVLLLPTLLPLVVVPACALLIACLGRRPGATLAAILWIGGNTGALDAMRDTGFLSGLWARPLPSLLWLGTAAAVLLIGRAPRARAAAIAGSVLILSWLLLGRREPPMDLADTLLVLTLDNHLWLVLGAAGFRRTRDPAAGALMAGGALLALIRALSGPGDVWAGAAFCRLGLVIATADWLTAEAPALAALLPETARSAAARRGFLPERLPTALVIAVALAGSFVAWWDPIRTDRVARESLSPVPEALGEAMAWMRTHTAPEGAVVVADDYAGAVPVLGGRRVLRAPALLPAPDDERRRRLQRSIFTGHPSATLLRRYGVRYLFVAPGQFRDEGVTEPEDLDGNAALRLVYANAKGMRLYEVPAAIK